jgi:hypothetical protein
MEQSAWRKSWGGFIVANSKKRCTYCKKYKPQSEMLMAPVGAFCDADCRYQYGMDRVHDLKKKTKDLAKKKQAKEKREFQLKDIKVRKAAAKKACHEYIRERDKNRLCICCGKPLGEVFHAGHFYESGNFSAIRYNEDNIHGQRVYCNKFKGGRHHEYRKGLIERIGLDRVVALDNARHNPVKRSAEDYLKIEKYYKDKLKELLK